MFETGKLNLRFATVMLAIAGVLALTYREDVVGVLLAPLTLWTAQTTLTLLHWVGLEATRTATVITHPGGFAYEIYYRCTGFLPAAILAGAILASPGPWRHKWTGLALGVPILIALNLARLIHLFYLGVYHPAAFDVAHTVVWEGVVVLSTLGLWSAWTRRSDSGQRSRPHRVQVIAVNGTDEPYPSDGGLGQA